MMNKEMIIKVGSYIGVGIACGAIGFFIGKSKSQNTLYFKCDENKHRCNKEQETLDVDKEIK